MRIFKKRKTPELNSSKNLCIQTGDRAYGSSFFRQSEDAAPLHVYRHLRESIPVIDAAINKIIRLVGDFKIDIADKIILEQLESFLGSVQVIGNGVGANRFLNCYLDSLLTFGNAIGEILLDSSGTEIIALFNSDATQIRVSREPNSIETDFWVENGFSAKKLKTPELILFSALNPAAGEINGNSLIKGLPFVSDILLKIFQSIGLNFDRIGNIRFAVNYKPDQNSQIDNVQEIAQNIASQWEQAMKESTNGTVRDFVAIGDIDIKVIGADNNVIDTAIPVRQMLEQIVAKMGIPPFLLGLNWSTTERMSKQQCEILISEIQSYRRVLTPAINKLVRTWLRLAGFDSKFEIVWDKINLYDEISQARAQLLLSQAKRAELCVPSV